MTKTWHKKTAVTSCFKMVFLEISNVPKGTVFSEQVTIIGSKFSVSKQITQQMQTALIHGKTAICSPQYIPIDS